MTLLAPSFQFSWSGAIEGILSPTLITAQCETLHITWSRGSNLNTGPLPSPPYSITIYSSAYQVPLIIDAGEGPSYDLTIPFAPGTKYIICMYDKNGYSGSCQHMYTVYPSVTPLPPTCSNFSVSERRMNVSLPTGSTSDTGWPDSCSYLSFLPNEGTPPYYFSAVGSARRPFNMTVDSVRTFSWQIAFDHSTPFFISIVDSSGLRWMHGRPLHAGYLKGNDLKCLAEVDGPLEASLVIKTAVATAVGTFVLGALLASLIHVWFIRRRAKKYGPEHDPTLLTPFGDPPTQGNPDQTSGQIGPHGPTHDGKPFSLSGARNSATTVNHLPYEGESSRTPTDPLGNTGGKIYVIHHDSEEERRATEAAEQVRPPLYTSDPRGKASPMSNIRPREDNARPAGAAPPNFGAMAAAGRVIVGQEPPGNEKPV